MKNVHDLLAKLAWDFTPEQLDHLFECFQVNWIRFENSDFYIKMIEIENFSYTVVILR